MKPVMIIFYVLEVLAGLSAISILFTRNVFYGALFLIVCLLSISGIFILVNAEFLAVTQILIYTGGVLLLIVFGVMVTSKILGKPLVVNNKYWLLGCILGASVITTLPKLFSDAKFYSNNSAITAEGNNSINQIGILFMTDYVLPFEVTGILLLIALIGAAVSISAFTFFKKL